MPFDDISAEHIGRLVQNEVFEDRTLEYKAALELETRDQRAEFLKDVSGFANGQGGTIVYGVREGEGDAKGRAIETVPMSLRPDATHQLIDEILRDGIDERIPGVLHKAVACEGGKFFYVVRIPPSPLAPHMVSFGQLRYRFYSRQNATTQPMNASEIKATALRATSAFDRASSEISTRVGLAVDRATRRRFAIGADENTPSNQALLHVVPLFPLEDPWELATASLEQRLGSVRAFGAEHAYGSPPRYTQDGLYNINEGMRHVAFLRSGAIEFQTYDVLHRHEQGEVFRFYAWILEQDIIQALESCVGLTADGLLPFPLMIQVTLLEVSGSVLHGHPTGRPDPQRPIEDERVTVGPYLLNAWGEPAIELSRKLFNEIWQSWGIAQSRNYEQDGTRRWYTQAGERVRSRPVILS